MLNQTALPEARPLISLEELQRVLGYHPDIGIFRWKVKTGPRGVVQAIAGTKDRHGYLVIQLHGVLYKAHRLAWFYITGEWPPEQTDHLNGVRMDNRFSNLRLASPGQNCQNTKTYKSNSTGFPGVVFHKRQKKFNATIKKDRVRYHLGCFDTALEASEAYKAAKRNLHEFQPEQRVLA